MSRDDSDIESSNPSKSFKVGDFDRLSGFFTPVWESKRRIRSESPIPASSPASSKSGAANPASKPTPSQGTATKPSPTKVAAVTGPAPAKPPDAAAIANVSPAAAAKLDAAAPANADTSAVAVAAVPSPTDATQRGVVVAAEAVPPQSPPAAGVKPATSPRESAAPARTRVTAPRPSVAALKQAGPNLPAEAFLDPKPDFRVPLSKSTPAPQAERINSNQRSLRASVAATRVHEQLRARAQADSFGAPELPWGTESEPEVTAVSPAHGASTAASNEPHPLHLLRRLRRTIHLSTPLPKAVREMIARYGRN